MLIISAPRGRLPNHCPPTCRVRYRHRHKFVLQQPVVICVIVRLQTFPPALVPQRRAYQILLLEIAKLFSIV
jgi:hypothetical protein